MYMCVYTPDMYTYIYIYIYTHTYVRTYIQVRIIHICTHIYYIHCCLDFVRRLMLSHIPICARTSVLEGCVISF